MATVFTPLPSLHLQQPAGPCHAPSTRAVLHDSSNTSWRAGKWGVGYIQPYSTKRVTFPTSSARLQESSSRCRKFVAPPPRFPFTFKAPPTVSISFSAACSQSRIPGFETRQPELSNVQNVVQFLCSPLNGDADIEMLDGTRYPSASIPDLSPSCVAPSPTFPTPLRRKRSSASSVSSLTLPSSMGDKSTEDPKDGSTRKRARKSKRHSADMWWLGMIHRSISKGLCDTESASFPGSGCDSNSEHRQTRRNTFQAQDRLLAGRIWQKLLDGGCYSAAMIDDHEGGTAAPLPSRMTHLSLPPTPVSSVLMPSPILASSAPVVECKAALDPQNNSVSSPFSNEATDLGFKFARPLCPGASPLNCPKPSIPIAVPPSRNLHGDFKMAGDWPSGLVAQRDPFTPPSSPEDTLITDSSKLRRSPSPPLRRSTPPPSRSATSIPQTPTTLTMPQLVASLTLAHRERRGLRRRVQSLKSSSKRSNRSTGDDVCCTSGPASQECDAPVEENQETRMLQCADRRSPLCRVAYIENLQPSCPY
ncbi:hypothetical protein J3A83DRAFT_4375420 [Scleroderma citrinum]